MSCSSTTRVWSPYTSTPRTAPAPCSNEVESLGKHTDDVQVPPLRDVHRHHRPEPALEVRSVRPAVPVVLPHPEVRLQHGLSGLAGSTAKKKVFSTLSWKCRSKPVRGRRAVHRPLLPLHPLGVLRAGRPAQLEVCWPWSPSTAGCTPPTRPPSASSTPTARACAPATAAPSPPPSRRLWTACPSPWPVTAARPAHCATSTTRSTASWPWRPPVNRVRSTSAAARRSPYDLARRIVDLTGSASRIRFVERPVDDPARRRPDPAGPRAARLGPARGLGRGAGADDRLVLAVRSCLK